jgi:hypothetical protein
MQVDNTKNSNTENIANIATNNQNVPSSFNL